MKAPLKLIALDEEDLGIVSFHVHNAQVRAQNMLRQMAEKRFALALHRFDWEEASADADSKAAGAGGEEALPAAGAAIKIPQEIPALLHFDHVLSVRSFGIDRQDSQGFLTIKGLYFHEKQRPGGIIDFLFAENAGLQCEVECIEARLEDLPADL